MSKIRLFLFGFLSLIILVSCTTGVFATWKYSSNYNTIYADTQIKVGMLGENWAGSDTLPEDILIGEDHYGLIYNIINHSTYGLNAPNNAKPIVRKLLEGGAGVVYGDQNVQGGNLKHMLLNTSSVDKLMFVVEYVTATEYNAYTFIHSQANRDNLGEYILVYKTRIVKESQWVGKESMVGKAKVFDPKAVDYSIDVTTWVAVESTESVLN